MDLIQQVLGARGFSVQSASGVTSSVRSTPNLCSPASAVLEFIKKAGGLTPSTLEGYRTTIAGTIRQVTGKDLTSDIAISDMLRSYTKIIFYESQK